MQLGESVGCIDWVNLSLVYKGMRLNEELSTGLLVLGLIFFLSGLNNEEVFIVALHEVFLPGYLFNDGRVVLQFFGQLALLFNLLGKVLTAVFQLPEFLPAVELYEEVVAVEEQHPHEERRGGEQVFVADDGEKDPKQFHGVSGRLATKISGEVYSIKFPVSSFWFPEEALSDWL